MLEPRREGDETAGSGATPPEGRFFGRFFAQRSASTAPGSRSAAAPASQGTAASAAASSQAASYQGPGSLSQEARQDGPRSEVVPPLSEAGRAEATGRSEAVVERVPRELGERMHSGFQDLSRLLGAIKETLSSRDGSVQQSLEALPGFLQQVPRIHRAEIECLAQISKQLEHMGSGTRDVVARLDGLPDLLRTLALGQAEQSRYMDQLQAKLGDHLEVQSQAIREGMETSRRQAETQLAMIKSIASTQEDIFSTFQNTQNRALNVFHRSQQQAIAQNRDTQTVMNRQIELLVDRVHSAQGRVFWLSIGFAALAAAGLLAVLFF